MVTTVWLDLFIQLQIQAVIELILSAQHTESTPHHGTYDAIDIDIENKGNPTLTSSSTFSKDSSIEHQHHSNVSKTKISNSDAIRLVFQTDLDTNPIISKGCHDEDDQLRTYYSKKREIAQHDVKFLFYTNILIFSLSLLPFFSFYLFSCSKQLLFIQIFLLIF